MKKILLLTTASLAMLMADFTLIGEQLTPVVTETTPYVQPTSDSTTSSKYLEPITLPTCDTNNPEVQFIKSNADWSTINDSSKRIFCVSPGDYTSLGNIKITASGTIDKRRYIVLNNGNNIHPGKLQENELANFKFTLSSASYWTIDRAACFGTNSFHKVFRFSSGSSNNILSRAYTSGIITSVILSENANNNTIQESRFQNMSHAGRLLDNPAIILLGSGSSLSIKNTKIIANEIVNCNDGIMAMISQVDGSWQIVNFEGTIIDSNDIYIDSSIYTDGNGNYNINGAYAYAENAIDMKGGSANVSNPILITNNRIWGYRKSDKTNSNISDPGYAIVIHYGARYTHINNNIIFDSNSGIGVGDRQTFPYAMYNGEIKDNLIYDCGQIYGSSSTTYSVYITSSSDLIMTGNVIINGRNAYSRHSYNKNGIQWTNNININSPAILLDNNTGGNYTENTTYGSEIEAGFTNDYVLTTDNFTNSPKVITLENVVKPN